MLSSAAGSVTWLGAASASELEEYELVEWGWLCERWVARVRGAPMAGRSLASGAREWFDWIAGVDRLAVTGVVLDGPYVLADLLGFVVEPAVRLGVDLVVVSDIALSDVDEAAFVETEFGYAHTLERLRALTSPSPPRRVAPAVFADTGFDPDQAQCDAVNAGGGVIQIIAPAGSGKTTVLVERVRELRRRGVPADAIACVTFNKAAKNELSLRLRAVGVGDVSALTFHGLGYMILRNAGKLRERVGDGPSLSQWRQLAAHAKKDAGEDGVWLDPGEAKRHLSNLKLGLLVSAREYAATINDSSDGLSRTLAAFYTAYEEQQRECDRMDFDDLILGALRLLREDARLRGRWQQQWECLLVDEYQDIEPAQELLVRILAAPHDRLFCVGDEDQTLYAFRRASVQRIICLDELYPALTRIALDVNYRCPGKIVDASLRLISVNQVRFTKRIVPRPGCERDGAITLRDVTRQISAAADVAQTLKGRSRGEIVVLARTTNALRPVALACADQGVAIDGPPRLFKATGARLALARHLRLALAPDRADGALIRAVCQTPSRGLAQGKEATIAASLRAGATLAEAFAGVAAPRRRPRAGGASTLWAPAELFSELAALGDGAAAVGLLRAVGGLDDWFTQNDELGGLDEFECEVLEQAEVDARGLSLPAYVKQLDDQADQLEAIRDKNGIELATIHGSKGRQWPHVIVVSCDDRTLPHVRSLDVSAEDVARGEGLEAERRLAYVAFTRAQKHLELYYDKQHPSRFLTEAGLLHAPAPRRPRPPRPLRTGQQRNAGRRVGQSVYVDAVAVAQRAADAKVAPAPSPPPAGRAPAPPRDRAPARARHALTADLVAQRRMSRRMTIERLARDLSLNLGDTAWLLRAVPEAGGRTKLRQLDIAQTDALARALLDLR